MYEYKREILTHGKSCKYRLYRKSERLRYLDFIKLLEEQRPFRSFFIRLLAGISFSAYEWETPPVTEYTTEKPFEFVIFENRAIDLSPDPRPFSPYFEEAGEEDQIAVFDNLGGDARLIAPLPLTEQGNYSHLGAFSRSAPLKQQHELWQTVGRRTGKLISERSLWLNTAGGGVAWLHLRLDSSPKYYKHSPYKKGDSLSG